jgi:hypothetical protein
MKLFTTFILTFLFLGIGCNRQNQTAEPACSDEVATSESVTVCEEKEETINIPHRGWQERTVSYENIGLKHPALYLEGPYEKKGSNDGYFKTWDGDSAISLAASPVIFAGNVIIWPVRMFQRPPWEMQISRCDSPVAEPVHAFAAEPSRAASKE